VHTAGVLRDVAADRARDLARRVRGVIQPQVRDSLRNRGSCARQAAPSPYGPAIDLQDAIELGERQQHAWPCGSARPRALCRRARNHRQPSVHGRRAGICTTWSSSSGSATTIAVADKASGRRIRTAACPRRARERNARAGSCAGVRRRRAGVDIDRPAAFERNALSKHLCRWMGQIDRCVHGDDGITRGARRGVEPVKAGTLTPQARGPPACPGHFAGFAATRIHSALLLRGNKGIPWDRDDASLDLLGARPGAHCGGVASLHVRHRRAGIAVRDRHPSNGTGADTLAAHAVRDGSPLSVSSGVAGVERSGPRPHDAAQWSVPNGVGAASTAACAAPPWDREPGRLRR